MLLLKKLAQDKGLSQTQLGEIMGVSQGAVSLMMRLAQDIKLEHYEALIAHFGKETIDAYTVPDTPRRMATQRAEAEMLQQRGHTVIAGDVTGNGNNFVAGDNNAVETTNDMEGGNEIPLEETVVVSADIVRAPGYDIKEKFMDGDLEGRIKPTQYIVPCHDLKAYTYCDDMEPEIRAGEPVLLKFMPAGCPISPGDMYFLDLPQGGKIRYVIEEKEGMLHLRAANHKAYGDIWVKREDVLSISQVMLIMRSPRSMNIDAVSLMDIIERRDEQTTKLIEQIDKAGERENRLISIIEQKHK